MRHALALPVVFAALATFALACSSSEPSIQVASLSSLSSSGSSGAVEADASAPTALTCPTASAPTSAVIVRAPEISETSGLAESRLQAGVFWAHNDSGDAARAYAIDQTGRLLTTLAFDAAPAVDIEDMAIAEEDGVAYLYFADIGNNATPRSEFTIHRVREPRVDAASVTIASEKMTFRYADGPKDAETLLYDPRTRDLLVVTKIVFGNAAVHRLGPFAAGASVTTTRIAGVPIALATGGEISRDGSLVAIRGYGAQASIWRRAPGEELAALFARAACKVPLGKERQGESFAFLADGTGYATLGEGAGQSLFIAHFQ